MGLATWIVWRICALSKNKSLVVFEKSKKRKKQKQKFVAIRLGVQRIKLRGVWGTLSFLEEIFVYE